jgi:inosine-uridine nucleoside N-ribohydrolase
MRVIVDNDFAGDCDDLFQLVHHLLSPSVEIRAIIGSHLPSDDGLSAEGRSAAQAVERVHELLRVMGMEGIAGVFAGAETALPDRRTPQPSAAVDAIVAEALRDDTDLPLYIVCGAGLTDLASALMSEPRVAERLTLIWIGGAEYPGLAYEAPGAGASEYNLDIDRVAAQYIFGESGVPIWQVPRNVYRQCLLSYTELEERVKPCGELGLTLFDSVRAIASEAPGRGWAFGETYAMGDSPLVSLTALQSAFNPDPSSCDYVLRSRPTIRDDGSYGPPALSGSIRVYTRIDTRLLFEDFFLKLRRFASTRSAP